MDRRCWGTASAVIGANPRAGLVFGGVLGRRPWLISGFQCKSILVHLEVVVVQVKKAEKSGKLKCLRKVGATCLPRPQETVFASETAFL